MRARLGRWLARDELKLVRAELDQALATMADCARALDASTHDLEISARTLELAESELRTRKIRLTGVPVWVPTASPIVLCACDGGVIVGAIVQEVRETGIGELGGALVDDGWRAYARLEGGPGNTGSVQWSQDLYSQRRAQERAEQMLRDIAAAAAARGTR